MFIHQKGDVGIFGPFIPQEILEIDLAGRGGENIIAANHLRNAREGVIHDNGQVIGKYAIGTHEDEIPGGIRE